MAIKVFPITAETKYSNDWHFPRSGGRLHEGNDLFAPEGSPIVAVDDGTIRYEHDPLGGHVAYLKTSDGDTFYYAHMLDMQTGNRDVRAGEQIGRVGKSGNAASTPAHLHFGRYRNGAAVNPYPDLMQAMHTPGAQVVLTKKDSSILPTLLGLAAGATLAVIILSQRKYSKGRISHGRA